MISLPIETRRLKIRYFNQQDWPAFCRFMLDENSTKFLMFSEEQKTQAGAQELFDLVLNSYPSDNPIYSLTIARREDDGYVGSCGFAPYDDASVECYYSLLAEETGQGYATEALTALVEQLSQQYTVRAYCHPQNIAGQRVAINAGFQHQGSHLHQHFQTAGELFLFPQRD